MQKAHGAENLKGRLAELFRGKMGAARIAALAVAVVLAVLSIFAFVDAAREGRVLVSRIVTVFGGVLMIALGAEVVLLVFTLRAGKPNFFLYNAASGRNLPVSSLTPALVSRRMDAYLARIAKSKGQLWLPGYLEACDFGAADEFRPVTAYKMLLDLVETDTDGAWRCFCASAPATVQWIADSLREYEPQMMKDILFIKSRFGTDPARIRDCLMRNAGYLQRRMVAYVAQNLEDFIGAV